MLYNDRKHENLTHGLCLDNQKPILTERAKIQLEEYATEEELRDILNCLNGYAELWFEDNDRLYLKKLGPDLFEVWSIRRKDGTISEIRKGIDRISEIVALYSRKDLFYSRQFLYDAKAIFNFSVLNGSYPLMVYAKQTEDKYLEYELKFLAGIATVDEIRYLESIIKRNRFIAQKKVYDTDSIEISGAIKIQERYFYRPELWLCEITVDGERRKCVWNKGKSEIIVQMDYGDVGFELNNVCRISNRLKYEFAKMVDLSI